MITAHIEGEFSTPQLKWWDYADDQYHSPEDTRKIDAWVYSEQGQKAIKAAFYEWLGKAEND